MLEIKTNFLNWQNIKYKPIETLGRASVVSLKGGIKAWKENKGPEWFSDWFSNCVNFPIVFNSLGPRRSHVHYELSLKLLAGIKFSDSLLCLLYIKIVPILKGDRKTYTN